MPGTSDSATYIQILDLNDNSLPGADTGVY